MCCILFSSVVFAFAIVFTSSSSVGGKQASRVEMCPHNEVYTSCLTSCERSCETVKTKERNCSKASSSCDSAPSCSCFINLVRHPNGSCVAPQHCPKETLPKCKAGEEVVSFCGSPCDNKCEELPLINSCVAICHERTKCVCKPGLYRNAAGSCVKLESCPKYKPGMKLRDLNAFRNSTSTAH